MCNDLSHARDVARRTSLGLAVGAAALILTMPVAAGPDCCGDPGAGACDEANGTPCCDDAECCELVCAQDLFCCDTEWDETCAQFFVELCFVPPDPACGVEGTGDCFVDNGTPYCDDLACCETVCGVDPFCCDTSWDALCAGEAVDLCDCTPGDEPANDSCSDAITIGLGDTNVTNECATPGGPDHATCNDGFSVGLGLDVWYTYTATFTGPLAISTCDSIDPAWDSQIAVYNTCDCAMIDDDTLYGCNNDGAGCSDGSSLVIIDVVQGECYTIRLGGTANGQSGTGVLQLSTDVPEPCSLDDSIPPQATPEPEPCGEDLNGGCNNDPGPPTFSPIACGDVIDGDAWADGGTRDTDWYELVITEETEVTLTIIAEFAFVAGFVETDPAGSGNCDDNTGFIDPAITGPACLEDALTITLQPGTYWPFVAVNGFNDVPCGGAVGNDYILSISCGDEDLCPADLNDSGDVDAADLAILLAAWNTDPGGPPDFDGSGNVDAADLAVLLAGWGDCPTP